MAVDDQTQNHASLNPIQPDEGLAKSTCPVAGEIVTETFKFDGERQVTAYVPPGKPEAIAFSGDG